MLRVEAKRRPSCAEILDTDFVRVKCEEFAIDLNDEPVAVYDSNNNLINSPKEQILEELVGDALLKTIKVPANLANLSSRLPKSNY